MKKNQNRNKPDHLLYINRVLCCMIILLLPVTGTLAVSEPSDHSGRLEASINAEQWELAREGEKIASLSELNTVIRRWSSASDKIIEIQYPGGEEGEIWVNELKGWLISLGVGSKYMMTVPGSGQDDLIRFKIINGGDNF
jgi:hypothetical protein